MGSESAWVSSRRLCSGSVCNHTRVVVAGIRRNRVQCDVFGLPVCRGALHLHG